MAISFIRIDDRIIHGQVVTRWAMENPCDGIIAVDDRAAKEPILKAALKSASSRKTFIYSYEEFLSKMEQASNSKKRYFLITRNPNMMAKILVENNMKVEPKVVNVGPQSAREGTINVNINADITLEEVDAFEKIFQHGYELDFRLVPNSKSVLWSKIRKKFNK